MKGHPGVPTDSSVLRMLETSQTLFLPPERITDRPFWAGHVPFALWLMEKHRPQLTVELGDRNRRVVGGVFPSGRSS